jgi:uncharacterized protein involved in tolerance to divalent cations
LSHSVELIVACRSWQDAQDITDKLLEEKLATAIETIEVATSSMRRHATGHAHSLKLVITTTEPKVVAVKQTIRSVRNGSSRPPYELLGAHMPSIVTKWLRSATEVKSGRLKR